MKQIIAVLTLTLLSSLFVNAQSGKKITFEEIGLSFSVPGGWNGEVKGDYYIMGHSTVPGLMILSQNRSQDAQQLKSLAMQGIREEGIQLSPKGDFALKGNDRVEGFYEGNFSGGNVRVFAIGLINKLGSGMNIFILTEKAKFGEKHIQEALKLAKSVKFFKERDSKETAFWKQRIVGKNLKYLKVRTNNNQYDGTFSGTSDRRTITLYNNGTFYYYSSSTASYGGPLGTGGSGMYAGRTNKSGDFKIYTAGAQTYLELYFSNKTLSYKLRVNDKRHTLLSGTRYSVLPIE